MSAVQRNRIRPLTSEGEAMKDTIAEQQREIDYAKLANTSLQAAVNELRERVQRHPKWCAFCAFVGFLIGGLAGKAF